MKKTLKLFMSVLMTFMLIFVYSFGNLVCANGTKIEESEYASYQEKETLKEVTTETGLVVKVPMFIEQGDHIIVSTWDGKYNSRG